MGSEGREEEVHCQPVLNMSQKSILSSSKGLWHTWHWVSLGGAVCEDQEQRLHRQRALARPWMAGCERGMSGGNGGGCGVCYPQCDWEGKRGTISFHGVCRCATVVGKVKVRWDVTCGLGSETEEG